MELSRKGGVVRTLWKGETEEWLVDVVTSGVYAARLAGDDHDLRLGCKCSSPQTFNWEREGGNRGERAQGARDEALRAIYTCSSVWPCVALPWLL